MSRQSLNQFISAIGDGLKPKNVVFYGGVNDVFNQCPTKIRNLPAYSYETVIRSKLENTEKQLIFKDIANFVIDPYRAIGRKLNLSYSVPKKLIINNASDDGYDCFINPKKTNRIAQQLINNWYTAYLLSKANGAEFLAILQPVIYTSNVNFDYFHQGEKNHMKMIKENFDVVYPEIISEMKKACSKDLDFCNRIIDGTRWLEKRENVWIDDHHLNGEGNRVIATFISNKLN